MRSHPDRIVYGPEPLKYKGNAVLPLVPMYGPAAWDTKAEVGPRDACERCGSLVLAHWIVCAGCHRVHEDNQRKLTAERRCDPIRNAKGHKERDKGRRPSVAETTVAKVADKRAKKTARDRKRFEQAVAKYRTHPEVQAWAAEHDLGFKAAS